MSETAGKEILGAGNWRLILLVGFPFWVSAGAVHTFGLSLAPTGGGPVAVANTPILIAQHLVLTAIALLLYLLALAVGWPRRRRLAAAIQHVILLSAFAASVPPILLASQTALAFRMVTALDYLVTYILGLSVILGVRAVLALREGAVERAEMQERGMRAHLYALRMQMNPHFAFNALNSIATLIDHDAPRARALLFSLSSLYQRTLQASHHEWHSLDEELSIAREYLDVQKTRAAGQFHFEFVTDDVTRNTQIPTLLLQPLVENAVLHGVAEDWQDLHIWVRAWRAGGLARPLRLGIEVGNSSNSLIPLRPEVRGLGLGNTEQRLASVYRGSATITCSCPDIGSYVVHLELPVVT